MNSVLFKKKLIKQTHNKKVGVYRFAILKIKPFLKRAGLNCVAKKAEIISKMIVIVKPDKNEIKPRLKVKFKANKTYLNQVNIVYLHKTQNIEKLPTKNCFKLTKTPNKILNFICLLTIGFFIGFINGFWGGGGGMVCVPTLTALLGVADKKAHATTILIMLPLSIASFVVYLLNGNINWNMASFVSGGFVLGGVLGALLLKNINNVVLRIVFSLLIIAGAIKMLIWGLYG